MAENRISRVKKERKARKRRRLYLALTAIIVLLAGHFALERAKPALGRFVNLPVRRVYVDDISFRNLFRQAGLEGNNMLALPLGKIAESTEKHPAIASVTIRKFYPDTLVVSITRRAPFATASFQGEEPVIVDREGKIFLPGNFHEPRGKLLRIVNPEGIKLEQIVPQVHLIIEKFSFYRPKEVVVHENHYTIVNAENRRVRIPAGRFGESASLLEMILDDFSLKEVRYKYIDLRFDEPVFLPETD